MSALFFALAATAIANAVRLTCQRRVVAISGRYLSRRPVARPTRILVQF